MKKALPFFTFPHSHLALNPAQSPQPDPISHRVPAESDPSFLPARSSKIMAYSEQNSQSNQDNMALLYSPEVPVSFQSRKEVGDTSPFNKRREDPTSRRYLVRPYDAQIEVNVISSKYKPSKPSSMISAKSEEKNIRVSQNKEQKKVFESVTYAEEGRGAKKPEKSIIKKLNFDFESQNTSRQVNQSSILKSKAIRNEKEVLVNETQENVELLKQVEELRQKLAEMENLNASLRMQYQICREKLTARQSQNQSLKESNDSLQNLCEESQHSLQQYTKMEEDFVENKRMVNLFCEEIQMQKLTIDTLSAKLGQREVELQRANDINSKWEVRLKQQTEACLSKLAAQQREIHQLNETVHKQKLDHQQLSQSTNKITQQLSEQIARITQNLAVAQQKQRQTQQLLSKANEEKRIAQERLQLATASIQALEKQQIELKSLLQRQESKLMSSEKENEAKQQKICHLQLSLQETKLNHEQQIFSLNTTMQESIAKLNAIMQESINRLKTTIQEKESQLQEAEIAKQRLLESVDRVKAEKEVYLNQVKQFKEENKGLQLEKDKLIDAVSKQGRTIEQKQARMAALNEQIVYHLNTIKQNKSEKHQLQLHLSELTSENSKKDAQIESQIAIHSHLSLDIASKNSKIAQFQQRILNYDKIIGSYKEALQQLTNTHEQRWQQLKVFYEEQFTNLQSQLKEYSQAENSKRNFRNFKKHLLKQNNSHQDATATVLAQSSKINEPS